MTLLRRLKQAKKCVPQILATACLTIASGTSVAEDIEIYDRVFNAQSTVGSSPVELNPNVLFILDTSGSMRSYVRTPRVGYDPTVIYGNSPSDRIYIYDNNLNFTNQSISTSQNVCQAYRDHIAANPNAPIFLDRIEQWKFVRFRRGQQAWGWRNSIDQTGANNVVECEDDSGRHGLTATSRDRYARNCDNGGQICLGNNPPAEFRRRSRDGRNPFDRLQHMVPANYHDYLQQFTNTPIGSGSSCSGEPDGAIIIDATTGQEFLCRIRLNIMQDALTNIANTTSDINIGLMDFNANSFSDSSPLAGNDGGTLIQAIGDINDATHRQAFISRVQALNASGNTPLAESLYEAYRYFRGDPRELGRTSASNTRRDTDGAALNGSSYRSPIINQCQDNNIVLLSDGQPTRDTDVDSRINAIIPGTCSGNCLDDLAGFMASTDFIPNNTVPGVNDVNLYTIGFTSNIQLLIDAANAGAPAGAALGAGYFQANDLTQLEVAFRNILSNIQVVDADTFVAPAVTVNAFNRLQSRDDIYYLLFRPEITPRWVGNLKKYGVRLTGGGDLDNDGQPDTPLDVEIVGDTTPPRSAIDEDTGFFFDDARSFWSSVDDGNVVDDGGASEQLDINRRLLGNVDSSTEVVVPLSSGVTDQSSNASIVNFLTQTVGTNVNIGEVGTGNGLQNIIGGLGATLNGIGDVDDVVDGLMIGNLGGIDDLGLNQLQIAAWTLGLDIDNERGLGRDGANNYLAETLHGTPYVLSFGTTFNDPNDVIFYTTNQGILHAVTGEDRNGIPGGTELWGYIPDESLFENLGQYYNRTGTDHVYGLDGEIAFSVDRSPTGVDRAHLYFGQRRGGNLLFAVDVTNATRANDPIQKRFTIQGGSGDFADMGQTWARPVVSAIRSCPDSADFTTDSDPCTLKEVIIVSGGYDTQYDDETLNLVDLAGQVQGNAMYIIGTGYDLVPDDDNILESRINDADRGRLLWMAGATVVGGNRDLVIPEMQHSIPSAPTVLDTTGDGAVDLMFFTDISGKIFRIDFDYGGLNGDGDPIDASGNGIFDNDNRESVAGGMIADLSEVGINRRFYNPLDTVLLPPEGSAEARYALVTGSGYRAHPREIEPFDNRIYVVFDKNISSTPIDELPDPVPNPPPARLPDYSYVGGQVIDINSLNLPAGRLSGGTSDTLDLTGVNEYGFFRELTTRGEKFLNSALISDFRAITTAFNPETQAINNGDPSCSGDIGFSVGINLGLTNGEVDFIALNQPGLAPQPVEIFLANVNAPPGVDNKQRVIIIGTEPFTGEELGLGNLPVGRASKTSWWEIGRGNGQ